jgi:acyl-coenzyme A synthetase/AMP-(fatty) acid ligase
MTVGDLIGHARQLAASLPDAAAAVNLCHDRANFLIALLALAMKRQICLMPPSRLPAVVRAVMAEHCSCIEVRDSTVSQACSGKPTVDAEDLTLDSGRVVAIGYTSGSTGKPKPNVKTWAAFDATTQRNARSIYEAVPKLRGSGQPWIVATVPSQHMYGMEFAVMLPLLGAMAIHSSHPLFPADIAAALAETPEPRILVSTPVHIKALLESRVPLPPIAAVLSATAPLSSDLAQEVEVRLGTTLLEFFGSTETCVIASRRTSMGAAWHPYDGVHLGPIEDGIEVSAPWLQQPVPMQDRCAVYSDGSFALLGRSGDLVEVAGKRASLADLNRRLLSIPGVIDGIVLQPDEHDIVGVHRLAALVVAPDLNESQIAGALGTQVDAAFIPRPLLRVPSLPRNETGKLPRAEVLAILRRHRLGPGRSSLENCLDLEQ